MHRLACLALFATLPLMAGAQSLSVADLQKQIDAEVNKGNEYTTLLKTPIPSGRRRR